MKISFSSSFKKNFRKRVKATAIEDLFWACLDVFIEDPFARELHTHKLSGKLKDLWSFKVEYGIRVVFYFTNDKPKQAVLVDIGTHYEVY
jgi:addiction module RelE/StbE family toxin